MKKKYVLHIFTLMLCMAFMIAAPGRVKAEEYTNEEPIYYTTEQGRFVNDIDEYLAQLNAGMIAPYNPTLTDHVPGIMTFSLSEPSKKCSNIFGHKWGRWSDWEEVRRYHYTTGTCMVVMERYHYCSRKHCDTSQTETDNVWVQCVH